MLADASTSPASIQAHREIKENGRAQVYRAQPTCHELGMLVVVHRVTRIIKSHRHLNLIGSTS